ncbi:hypothetical protein JB92DRAFT_2938248 [Gautieria morchelliformis]|nr:hypothetical protein JB92DRAFT_2938248 [Gautieria morchelliformis]
MSYPHLSSSTQLTSRAALFQDDELGNTLLTQSGQESPSEVQQLHDLVRRSLGNFEACQTGAERQKLNEVPLEVDPRPTDTPFRLISRTLPARPIQLTSAHHSSVRNQRPAEDTVDEARLRQLRAHEAAVDTDQVLIYTHPSSPRANSTSTDTTNASKLPNLLVTERHPLTVTAVSKAEEIQTKHGLPKCCPFVPLTDKARSDKPKRKRKKHRPVRDRPLPAFYRPMEEWGGKSAGYALGWRGSWPVGRLESSRYVRDKMRKGTLGNLD